MSEMRWDDERVYALLDLADQQGGAAFIEQVIDSMINNMIAYSIALSITDGEIEGREAGRLREFVNSLCDTLTSDPALYTATCKSYAALWVARRA